MGQTCLQVLLDQSQELHFALHFFQLPPQFGQHGLHLGAWGWAELAQGRPQPPGPWECLCPAPCYLYCASPSAGASGRTSASSGSSSSLSGAAAPAPGQDRAHEPGKPAPHPAPHAFPACSRKAASPRSLHRTRAQDTSHAGTPGFLRDLTGMLSSRHRNSICVRHGGREFQQGGD